MQRLEVSGAVRPLYGSLGVNGLIVLFGVPIIVGKFFSVGHLLHYISKYIYIYIYIYMPCFHDRLQYAVYMSSSSLTIARIYGRNV
jgi:hypothetical protein